MTEGVKWQSAACWRNVELSNGVKCWQNANRLQMKMTANRKYKWLGRRRESESRNIYEGSRRGGAISLSE